MPLYSVATVWFAQPDALKVNVNFTVWCLERKYNIKLSIQCGIVPSIYSLLSEAVNCCLHFVL